MSLAARDTLVSNLVFQAQSQKEDLLNEQTVHSELIGLLLFDLIDKGFKIEVTAVKTDHHDDSALGEHCHFNGWAIDCWPLNSSTPGDYIDASTHDFRAFLVALSKSPYLFQIGLAGSADTPENHEAAGPTCFSDDGADHVHIGAQSI